MAINREKAIHDLSLLQFRGNKNGLIEGFNVLVNFLPSFFWNSFSEKILQASSVDEESFREAERGLELAASECGYHTGYGIITSDEFKAIIGPMIEKMPEDILHGAYCVLTAWGWANAEIVELVPAKRMVVRAYSYYELDIKDTMQVKKPCAYMLTGICRAFMDLAYGKPYPNGLGTFQSVQTKGIEVGDPYAEFIVTPRETK